MIRAGRMRTVISIDKKLSRAQFSNGPEYETIYKNIRAEELHLNSRSSGASTEIFQAPGQIARNIVRYRIRYLPGIRQSYRVLDGGLEMDITGIENVRNRNRELVLTCEHIS